MSCAKFLCQFWEYLYICNLEKLTGATGKHLAEDVYLNKKKKTIVNCLKNKRHKGGSLFLGIHLFIFTKKCNFLTFNPRFKALRIFGKFSCSTLNRNEEHTLMLAQRENDDSDRQNQHLMNDNAVKDKRYVFVYNNL